MPPLSADEDTPGIIGPANARRNQAEEKKV